MADQDVALLDLETLGQAPRDVDQGAFSGVAPDADSVPVADDARLVPVTRLVFTAGPTRLVRSTGYRSRARLAGATRLAGPVRLAGRT